MTKLSPCPRCSPLFCWHLSYNMLKGSYTVISVINTFPAAEDPFITSIERETQWCNVWDRFLNRSSSPRLVVFQAFGFFGEARWQLCFTVKEESITKVWVDGTCSVGLALFCYPFWPEGEEEVSLWLQASFFSCFSWLPLAFPMPGKHGMRQMPFQGHSWHSHQVFYSAESWEQNGALHWATSGYEF